jgi:hypothetical protein
MPAIAQWAKTDAEAFVRATAHPDAGVTVRVTLQSVPGLSACCASCGSPSSANAGTVRTKPSVSVSVQPGKGRA